MLKKLVGGSLFLLISTVFSKLFVFLVNVFVARYSSQEIYGQFALVRSSVNMVETTFSSALNPLVIKVTSVESISDEAGRIFLSIFIVSIISVLALFIPIIIFSNDIAHFILKENNFALIALAALLIGVTIVNGVLISMFIANSLYLRVFVSSFISSIVLIPVSYMLVIHYLATGALIGLILFHLLDVSIKCTYVLKENFFKSISGRAIYYFRKVISIFGRATVPLLAASLLNGVVFWGVRMLLVEKSDGFSELAKFDIAFQFLLIEMMVLNSVTTISLSIIVRSLGDDKKVKLHIFMNLIAALLISLVMTSSIYLLAPYLLLIFGESYSYDILRSMTLIPVLYSFAIVLNRLMIAKGNNHVLFWVALFSSISMFCYAYYFLNSAIDLVYAFTIYYLVSGLVYFFFLAKVALLKHTDQHT